MTDPERLAAHLDALAEGSRPEPPDEDAARVVAQLRSGPTWSGPPPELRDAVLSSILGGQGPAVVPAPSPSPAAERSPAPVVPLVPRWRRLAWAVPLAAAAAVLISVGTLVADRVLNPATGPGVTYSAASTPYGQGATADVTVASAAGGFSVVLAPHGLKPAPAGYYYAAWLKNGTASVPLGSFHARTTGEPITLWSGVDPRDYPTLTVTLQQEGQPPLPASARLVMTASLKR